MTLEADLKTVADMQVLKEIMVLMNRHNIDEVVLGGITVKRQSRPPKQQPKRKKQIVPELVLVEPEENPWDAIPEAELDRYSRGV